MPAAILADLHAHTTASDGELEPEALVDAASAAGLNVLAVTDHDTVAGVARAQARGTACGLEIVPGCELTAYYQNVELHILAFFVDIAPDAPLAAMLETLRVKRKSRAFEMAARLTKAGFPLSDEDVIEAAGGADSIGKPHVAAALVKRGHARSVRDGLLRFLVGNAPGNVPKQQLSPEEVFAAVHEAGGVAVLAHPGIVPHDELIAPLFRLGMDGVEAYHLSHSDVNRRFYAGLARRYEKAVSGGSDFHGPGVKPGVTLGASGVDEAILADLRKRAAARAERLSRATPASIRI
ncbi:MAG: PHP domain-containing protein [Planctomycetota bacterium]|nr:PHP domain-containing protein [Planctomycetota bacterium]